MTTATAALDARRVLMVAYHFPPLAGSSGIQRTLRFMQHLPQHGWEPLVLTTHPRAYERTSDNLDAEVPPETVVRRAFALDTARQLSLGGRYLGAMARPDRWISWKFDGVRTGLQMVRRHAPSVLWSTFPIATAHVIGAALHRRTGLPWVADFRDPMAQDGYPTDPKTHASYAAVEREVILNASASVFTTPSAAREYRRRYPQVAERIVVLENGYDEPAFAAAEQAAAREPLVPGCFILLHSGIVYPSERDPTQLLQALQMLAARGAIQPGKFKLRFRASAHDGLLREMAARYAVEPFIELAPPLGYKDALGEMLRADALLVLQASNCNEQIPAKIYEYMRARRPIVALTDPAGDTAQALRDSGVGSSAPLDDAAAIADLLQSAIAGHQQGVLADETAIQAASRSGRTAALAAILHKATTAPV